MKQLLIIRHSKSDWDNPGLTDFERPLNKRGNLNASEMANRLLAKKIIPQCFISSPATRAISTANCFAEVLGLDKNIIKQEKNIYEAPFTALLHIVTQLDDRHDLVALFGHNPGLIDLVIYLSGQGVHNIPTCGMVLLEFPFDNWELISASTGELIFFDYPKNPNI